MTRIVALVVSSVLLCPLSAAAQESRWDQLSTAGMKAYEGRNPAHRAFGVGEARQQMGSGCRTVGRHRFVG